MRRLLYFMRDYRKESILVHPKRHPFSIDLTTACDESGYLTAMKAVVVSDTVGFIRKLPHQLVEAFKATLEELEYADLLLHVIDVSNPEWQQQAQVVENLILELGAGELPRIDVFNKSDLLPVGEIMPHGEDIVSISAKTGEGIDKLLEMIDKRLDKGSRRCVLHIPYDKGGLLDMLYREAKVESVEYGETIDVVAVCGPRTMGQVAPYAEP